MGFTWGGKGWPASAWSGPLPVDGVAELGWMRPKRPAFLTQRHRCGHPLL